jgi:DNA topoisomerase-1
LKGRYGPFVTDGEKNASVPKDVEPETLDLDTCRTMLAEAPARGRFGRKKKGSKKKAAAKKTTTKKKTAKKKAAKKKATKRKAAKKKAAAKA